jgi:serine/threonine-protein kinase RsbW
MTPVSKIALPARLENLPALVASVRKAAESLTAGPRRILDIELALEEALVNIINYAYRGQRPGDIEVACATDDGGTFFIEIADSGAPFNILSVPPPDLTLDISEREPGGLGIHFMKQLMDKVTYRRENDRNILEFQVRLEKEEGTVPES